LCLQLLRFTLLIVTAPPLQSKQAIVYLCACIPNHLYKFLTAYSRPKWTGFLIVPATVAHWLLLLVSQTYFFTQCACSEWGCLYPGSVFMLICEWSLCVWVVISELRIGLQPAVGQLMHGLPFQTSSHRLVFSS